MSDEKHNGKYMGLVRGKECYSTDPRDVVEGQPRHCGLCGAERELIVLPIGVKSDPYGWVLPLVQEDRLPDSARQRSLGKGSRWHSGV